MHAPGAACVEDPAPDALAGRDLRTVGVEAGVDGAGRLVAGDAAGRVRLDVREPLVHRGQRLRRLIERRRAVREPDHGVRRVAVEVQHPLTRGERLVRVVHVELALEVVAPVDHRDVDRPRGRRAPTGKRRRIASMLPSRRGAGVRPPSGLSFMLRRLHGSNCAGFGAEEGEEGAALLHHVLRLLPATRGRVQLQELGGRDLPAFSAARPYWTPTLSQVERPYPNASTP